MLEEKGLIAEKGIIVDASFKEENASNKEKSKVRVRVEHVFGFMKTTMKVDKLRTIGKERIEGVIGLLNLSYNICRYVYLRQSLG